MTLKDKLLVYIYNKCDRLDDDYRQLELNTRYRKMDECDHLEFIIAKVRRDSFNEFYLDLLNILNVK